MLYAQHIQTCKVKYRANYGYSKYYTIDVTFLTGREINKATKSYDYDSYSKYAVIFWGENQASIIKIDNYLSCSNEFTRSCLPSYQNITGEDQEGKKWEICTQSSCY